MNMDLPSKAKSLVHLTFFDEPDKKLEASHWEYWYNIQANPNQRAFDIGMGVVVSVGLLLCVDCGQCFLGPANTRRCN